MAEKLHKIPVDGNVAPFMARLLVEYKFDFECKRSTFIPGVVMFATDDARGLQKMVDEAKHMSEE